MANHTGNEGVVKIGTATVAEVKSWSIDETTETLEDTVIGDTARTRKPSGISSWSGSLEAFWDETDTLGQGAMTIGAEVTLNLYPEGAVSGDTYFTGSAIITSISRSASFNGMVEASFSFEGNGALTQSTVV
jgi:hypothetical protein